MALEGEQQRMIQAMESVRTDGRPMREAARMFGVSYTTLSRRLQGAQPRSAVRSHRLILSEAEESQLVEHAVEMEQKGFPLSLATISQMASCLTAARGKPPVGEHWSSRFVGRFPQLNTSLTRSSDFQRSLCKNRSAMEAWLQKFSETCSEYGIADGDIYNMDEVGLDLVGAEPSQDVASSPRNDGRSAQPGNSEKMTAICCISGDGYILPPYVIFTGRRVISSWFDLLPKGWGVKAEASGATDNAIGVDWLRHFDERTSARTRGQYRLLVLDGHASHQSPEFKSYCESHKIILCCFPPPSSHLTQPLDQGISALLRESVSELGRHPTLGFLPASKSDVLLTFSAAFAMSFSEASNADAFRDSGLVPFSPGVILSMWATSLHGSGPTPRRGRTESRVSRRSQDLSQLALRNGLDIDLLCDDWSIELAWKLDRRRIAMNECKRGIAKAEQLKCASVSFRTQLRKMIAIHSVLTTLYGDSHSQSEALTNDLAL